MPAKTSDINEKLKSLVEFCPNYEGALNDFNFLIQQDKEAAITMLVGNDAFIQKELTERACIEGHHEILELILTNTNISANSTSENIHHAPVPQHKLLGMAVAHNHLNCVKELLKHGADINTLTASETVLHLAVQGHNTEMVKLLLKNGADITIKNESNKSVFDVINPSLDADPIMSIFERTIEITKMRSVLESAKQLRQQAVLPLLAQHIPVTSLANLACSFFEPTTVQDSTANEDAKMVQNQAL